MPDQINADIAKLEASIPHEYERRKPQVDQKLRNRSNIQIFLMVILIIIFLLIWSRLDNIYAGNPNSDGRKLLCAIAVDNAEKNPNVDKVYRKSCSEFLNELNPE